MTLQEVLHAHIPTLTAASTVRDAVDKMDIYQFPALVVVDGDMVPTHVVTEGDIVRGITYRNGIKEIGGELAHNFGSPNPLCMEAGATIDEALSYMLERGLTILPVIDKGRLSGVVLRVDLMQALLMLQG